MLPFLLPALKFAAPAILGAITGRKSAGRAAPSDLDSRYTDALKGSSTRAGTLQGEGDRRMMSFDPKAMLADTIHGYANQEKVGLDRSLDSLAGRAASTGRLNTGFFDLDQGDLVRESNSRLQDVIAQTGTAATQMTMQNNNAIANQGDEANGEYLDLLTGGMDRAQAQKNADAQSRTGMFGAGAQLLGSVLGSNAASEWWKNRGKTPSMVDAYPSTMSPIRMGR